MVDAFVPRYFAPEVYIERPEFVERARAIAGATDPRGAAAMLRGMAERVASNDLFDEIDIPVAVVAGRFDAFVGPEELQKISDGIRGATFHVLECGHFPQWEAPEALDQILAALHAAAQ